VRRSGVVFSPHLPTVFAPPSPFPPPGAAPKAARPSAGSAAAAAAAAAKTRTDKSGKLPPSPKKDEDKNKDGSGDNGSDDYTDDDNEGLDGYRPGGYHPVRLGDRFKDGRYVVRGKLGWGHFSTVWLVEDKGETLTEARARGAPGPGEPADAGASAPPGGRGLTWGDPPPQSGHRALKVQKSQSHYTEAARDEVRLLKEVCGPAGGAEGEGEPAPGAPPLVGSAARPLGPGSLPIAPLVDAFDHVGPHGRHVCLVFPVLGDNLLSLIKAHSYRGAPLEVVKRLAAQMLSALAHMHADGEREEREAGKIWGEDAGAAVPSGSSGGGTPDRRLSGTGEVGDAAPMVSASRRASASSVSSFRRRGASGRGGVIHTDLKPENVVLSSPLDPERLAERVLSGQAGWDYSALLRAAGREDPGPGSSDDAGKGIGVSGEKSKAAKRREKRKKARAAAAAAAAEGGHGGGQAPEGSASGDGFDDDNDGDDVEGPTNGVAPDRPGSIASARSDDPASDAAAPPAGSGAGSGSDGGAASPPASPAPPAVNKIDPAAARTLADGLWAEHRPHTRWPVDAWRCAVVDFGNACWERQQFTSDVQTRQYRAPEVLLGAPYGTPIDVWSLACVAFEVATGDVLFDPRRGGGGTGAGAYTRDEDHLALMLELVGGTDRPRPPAALVRDGKRASEFFTPNGDLKHIKKLRPWPLLSVLTEKYELAEAEAAPLASFLGAALRLDPARRATAAELLRHEWLRGHVEPATPGRGWRGGELWAKTGWGSGGGADGAAAGDAAAKAVAALAVDGAS